MLRSAFAFLATTLMAGVALAATVGEPAPSFSGVDVLSGKTVTNADVKGKIVVMEWNNFECPFTRKFYDSNTMQTLQTNAVKDGVVWITVNSSAPDKEGSLKDAATAKAAVAEHHNHASYYVLDHDGVIGHAFGAKTTPHMFIIDAAGTLAYQGAIDSIPSPYPDDIAKATNYVTAGLKALKAGTPIKPATTQAYGCFVKY